MKIIIIEDEHLVAEGLTDVILKIDKNTQIVAILYSIEQAIKWFNGDEFKAIGADLIFSDIQLGDGLSFEIFKNIKCNIPIVFCTAYNKYTLEAFKTSSIDYIIKPFDETKIANSINKYRLLKENFTKDSVQYDKMFELFVKKINKKNSTVLVNDKDGVIPINLCDIAYFYLDCEITYLTTFNQNNYTINKSLEEIEEFTDNDFYRVNRQYLICRKIVKKVQKYSENQHCVLLNINFPDKFLIRRVKIPEFYEWMKG